MREHGRVLCAIAACMTQAFVASMLPGLTIFCVGTVLAVCLMLVLE